MKRSLESEMDIFLQHMQSQFPNKDDPFKNARSSAWYRLQTRDLPVPEKGGNLGFLDKEYSLAREVDIDKEKIAPFVRRATKRSYIIFVNGFFRKDLSDLSDLPEGTILTSLDNAAEKGYLDDKIFHGELEEDNFFSLLNIALHPKGAYLYLPAATLKFPVHILQVVSLPCENMLLSPYLYVHGETSSRCDLFSTLVCLTDNPFCLNQLVDFTLRERSQIKYIHHIKPSENSFCVHTVKGLLKEDSFWDFKSFTFGGNATRLDCRAILQEKGAGCDIQGIWMLEKQNRNNTNICIRHVAPFTSSYQQFRGVLKDQSISSFHGKVFVSKKAQKTRSVQLNKNLILGEGARAKSQPDLEIYTDNVKVSHGVTTSWLNKLDLFYLKSRGLSEKRAKALLIEGFCGKIIRCTEEEMLRREILENVQKNC